MEREREINIDGKSEGNNDGKKEKKEEQDKKSSSQLENISEQ